MPAFAELTARDRLLELVRWIAVIPVSLLCGVLSYAAVLAGNSSACTGGRMDPETSIEDYLWVSITAGAVQSGAGVWTGAHTAPRAQFATAVVLSGLWILMDINAAYWLVVSGNYARVMPPLAGIIGAVGVVFLMKQQAKA